MTKSFEVARQFETEFSRNNQIFVTSHSPSFYGLSGNRVGIYYVRKIEHGDGTLVSDIEKLGDVSTADQNLGIAHIISDRSKAIFDEIETLKKNLNSLRTFANPVIITEGKHDKHIIESAISKTSRGLDSYTVMCCERSDGEGGGAVTLKQTLENIPAAEANIRIGVFDRDVEGLSAFENLKRFKNISQDLKTSPSGRTFALVLPEVEWDDPYFDLSGRQRAIEQMFPRDVVGEDLIVYRFDVSGGTIGKKDVDKLLQSQGLQVTSKLVRVKIEISNKTLAASRIALAPVTAYTNMETLLATIDACISQTEP